VGATIVLFNRDLRVTDHPALASAAAAGPVVPLFVLDHALVRRGAPNRLRFLLDSLHDLRHSLRSLGADLVVRAGDTVTETVEVIRAVGASTVATSADVSAFAQRRQRSLADACAEAGATLELHPGVTIVPPGELRPTGGGGHFRVFTPYWRRWSTVTWRDVHAAPSRLALPSKVDVGRLPSLATLASGTCSPDVVTGGEGAGLRRLDDWLDAPSVGPWETSRLSPYLRFGCLSPLDVACRVADSGWEGADELVRQLCWRDFFHQVVADFPAITHADYRPRPDRPWRPDAAAFAAWAAGSTGVPLVDAGMRQLRQEGWMPNRARLVAASYLTKTLGVDWRLGAAHFAAWLVDGDVPCNYGNWQWAAGTGNDTRPNRVLNPVAQARRFDRDGAYVRRWLIDEAPVPPAATASRARPGRRSRDARGTRPRST
jgi:deoxyribodipyrimidine photo-lyase